MWITLGLVGARSEPISQGYQLGANSGLRLYHTTDEKDVGRIYPHLGGTLLPMRIKRNDVVGLGRVNVASSKNQRQVKRSCSGISSRRKKARCIKTTEKILKSRAS